MTDAHDDDVASMSEGEARAEVLRLRRIIRRMSEPEFGPFTTEPDGTVSMHAETQDGPAIIGALASMLEDPHACNYVALSGWSPAAGRIEAIVQRVGKLSPHEARVVAEQHLKRAVRLLAEHGIQWDGPTEFLPDLPPERGLEAIQDGVTPWARLDVRSDPNRLYCERCGGGQDMPRRGTAAIMVAVIEAFRGQHEGCQEGDKP